MSFMNRLSFLGRWRFHGADLEESTDYLPNPSCGWYRMFPFELDKEPDFDEKELKKAVEAYQNRDRRFGGLSAE